MFLKKIANRSLSFRLTSRFTTLLVVSHLFFLLTVAFVLKQELATKDRNLVHARHKELQTILENDGLKDLIFDLQEENKTNFNYHLLVRILDKEGNVLYEKMPERLKNFSPENITKNLNEAFTSFGARVINPRIYGEETIELLSSPASQGQYVLISGLCTEESEDFMGTFFKAALLGALFSILLSVGVGYLYSRNSLAPIRSLISSIQEIQRGSTRTLVPMGDSKDELHDLTDLFNKMILQINHLIDSLQLSLDSIAHDLRTPITHLTNKFEDAIKKEQTLSKEFVHECLEEVQGINNLLTTLLEISEAQAGSVKIRKTSFDMRRLLLECAELYEYVAEEKEATIEVVSEQMMIFADRSRLKRIIANLIDNALKYSNQKVHIHLSALVDGGEWVLRVKDNGWGIAPEDVSKIWQRLYRGDSSRSTQGMGLGLSFVKSIVELHGGSISVTSAPQAGSLFVIRLPVEELVEPFI